MIAPSQVPSSTANSIQVMKVCQALTQTKKDVRLWLPGNQPAEWNALASYYGLTTPFDIRWLRCPLFWHRYDLAWNSLHEARIWGAQIIYTWMLQTAILALWQGLPVIFEMHMPPSGYMGPLLFRWFMHHQGKKRLLIITDALRQLIARKYKISLSADEIQIAPMGNEPERYATLPDPVTARKQLGFPQGLTVVYTGHFYQGRGMEILLGLAKAHTDVRFLWIGGLQTDVEFWQARLDEAGLKNVLLTGFVENQKLPLYQAAADVLLMPYGEEVSVSSGGDTAAVCSPMKMFEYLAVGRAILSSDLPVFHEVLNENNAYFCPPNDLNAWQIGLAKLLEDDRLRQRLATQAKVDAQQFSWQARAVRALKDW